MCRLTIFASHCKKNASSSSKDRGFGQDPRAWSVPNEKIEYAQRRRLRRKINSTSKSEVFQLERLYQPPKKMKASLSKSISFQIHSSKCSFKTALFPNFNLQILSSKSNLRSSFTNLFNFKFSKTCWKSPKLYKRSLTHFEKMSLAHWFWAFLFFWKTKVFCLVGPRHTTNPFHIRKFWVQKVIHKRFLNFSDKVHRQFKTILHLSPKHMTRHYPLKIRPDFDLKKLEFFNFRK